MSALTNVWRQLVQRRLWPMAILLIAALAAVPLALAEEADQAAPEPAVAPADSGESELAIQPIVAQATAADRSKRRKVLGARKNPFGLPKNNEAGSATAPSSEGSTTAQEPSSPAPANNGGTPPSSGGGPSPSVGGSAPAPTAPTAPMAPAAPAEPAPKKYALHELTVRFGDSASGDLERQSIERLQPLPSAEEPVLIYLGVLDDGKTAVFLVDHGVEAIGDGDCTPAPETCETIRLRAGDTEFLDVKDATGAVTAQYQLDLVKIHKTKTASVSRARASSKAGARVLKARVAADGPTGYRWDAAAGALERRPHADVSAAVVGATVGLR